ncbi:Clp protease N-terminal domain-containing protein [Nocardia tengchongensis]
MFERFTDTARRTIVLAQEEARLLGHDWIGTEHLLLGLLHGDDPIAGQTLGELGLDLSGLRERVDQAVGVQDSHAPAGHIPFTARSKKVLENSLREAMRLQHSYIGPEHLLLALVSEGSGVASQVLISQGAEPGEIRSRVRARMQAASATPGPGATETELRQRITELERRVAELERRLDGPDGPIHGDIIG